jgi:dipeptidyl aminopeptidase/acylaminoacyl peptidase
MEICMRIWSHGLCAGLVLGLVAVDAVAADGPSTKFEGADLFRLECATDPQIRPDGKMVAYVRRSYDVMTDRARTAIWLIDVQTGAQSPLAAGPGSSSTPHWSPDGGRIAFVARGDDGRAQLMVRWLSSGEQARIADLTEAPRALTWSPDGRSIAFAMFAPGDPAKLGEAPRRPTGAKWAEPLELITDVNYRSDDQGYLRPGQTHLYVVSADGGAPRQLTFGPYDEQGPLAWSADGRYLVVSGQRTEGWRLDPQNSELYRVALSDGTITQLTRRVGPDHSPEVSPDGRHIAYLGFDDHLRSEEDTRLYVMDEDGGNAHSLTDHLDRSVDAAHWAADGKSIYVSYVDHGVGTVARVFLDGRLEPVASGLSGSQLDRPYSGGQFTVARDGTVAYTSGTAVRPSDVSVVRGRSARQLTHLNEDLFRERTLAPAQPLPVTSSFDQRPIDAWLLVPPASKPGERHPLILEIHGGPFTSYGPVFSTDDQLYAAAGYAVVYANPRGSTSYGADFANLIHHDYPGHDYDDLMSAVDAAIAAGAADPDQLYVTGGSGGGVLTAWIVGQTRRFRAAATQKPVINWAGWTLTTDMYPFAVKYWFAKRPWDDPDTYWKHSPLSLVGAVTTPTLVVVGDADYRTPVSDAEQYYQALQLRGIPTALIKVPGASHGSLAARPSQSAAKASAIIAWFNRYRAPPH